MAAGLWALQGAGRTSAAMMYRWSQAASGALLCTHCDGGVNIGAPKSVSRPFGLFPEPKGPRFQTSGDFWCCCCCRQFYRPKLACTACWHVLSRLQ